MQIWNYDPATGELLGPSFADPNPVEAGEWLIPAHATTIDPGAPQAGRVYRFSGEGWSSVPDCRGQTWWKADAEFNNEPVRIDFIGDPAEQGLTSFEPPAPPVPPPAPVVVTARQIRLALNRLDLRAAVEAYIATADQDTRDTWQYAAEFPRDHGMIETAAVALGKSPGDVDGLFWLAKSL